MNTDKLLSYLTILDFMAVDLALYLNTHPDDAETIEKYNAVIEEADRLRFFYDEEDMPLYSFRSKSRDDYFSWVDKPWPPSFCFNKSLEGQGCPKMPSRKLKERECY